MADYVWTRTGKVAGYDAVAGEDVPDSVEALPSRAIRRMLDRGYMQLKSEGVDPTVMETVVNSASVDHIVVLTQAAYTALDPKDDRTLYVIEG